MSTHSIPTRARTAELHSAPTAARPSSSLHAPLGAPPSPGGPATLRACLWSILLCLALLLPATADTPAPTDLLLAEYTAGKIAPSKLTLDDFPAELSARLRLAATTPEALEKLWEGKQMYLKANANAAAGTLHLVAARDAAGKAFFFDSSTNLREPSFVRAFQNALATQERFNAALHAADQQKADPPARAQKLDDAASIVGPGRFAEMYPALVEEITKLDAENKLGLGEKYKTLLQTKDDAARISKLHFDLTHEIDQLSQPGGFDAVVTAIDRFIARHALQGLARQSLEMRKYLVWANAKQYDKAIEVLDHVEKIDPASPLAKNIPGIRKRMEDAKAKAATEKPPEKPATPPAEKRPEIPPDKKPPP